MLTTRQVIVKALKKAYKCGLIRKGRQKVKMNADDAKNLDQSEVILITIEGKKLTGIAFCCSIS
jgi:hypothetical protein